MTFSRSVAASLVAAGLVAAGCSANQSSASSTPASDVAAPASAAEPPPTIGLGVELDLEIDLEPVEAAVVVEAVEPEEIDTIVMIGDSITVASTPALQAQFAALGLDDPVIVSQVGKRMARGLRDNPSGAEVAEFLNGDETAGDDRSNELWVVALGTNDIGQYSADEAAGAVNELLGEVPPEAALVWVDTYYRDEPDGEAQINRVIADRVARRGNGVVAPWSFFAGGDGVLRSDGVHPSSSGAELFAAVVAETAARFLGR